MLTAAAEDDVDSYRLAVNLPVFGRSHAQRHAALAKLARQRNARTWSAFREQLRPGPWEHRLQVWATEAGGSTPILIPQDLGLPVEEVDKLSTADLLAAAIAEPDHAVEIAGRSFHRAEVPMEQQLARLTAATAGQRAIGVDCRPGDSARPHAPDTCAVTLAEDSPDSLGRHTWARRWIEVDTGRRAAVDWLRDNDD